MKCTYIIRHHLDYSIELEKAKQIAEWAIQNRYQTSSKLVKHFHLNAGIACQILRKYGMNSKCKKISNVKLTIPGQIIYLTEAGKIRVPSIKAVLQPWFDLSKITKICQIEVDNQFYYVTCEVKEEEQIKPDSYLGIDLNATEHFAVISNKTKIIKRGKNLRHLKETGVARRARLQRKKQFKLLKKTKDKENRRVKDQLHKISREIVDLAEATNQGIRLENLEGIKERTTKKYRTKHNRITNNWNYYLFRQMIEYKAKICGVEVQAVNPAYTSKTCSRCKKIGLRDRKKFQCDNCGHADHADANAAFNISAVPMITSAGKVPSTNGCYGSATSVQPMNAGLLGVR